MDKITIDKGIPIPDVCPDRYPLEQMEIGDSFLVRNGAETFDQIVKAISQRAEKLEPKRRFFGTFWPSVSVSTDLRIWRVE